MLLTKHGLRNPWLQGTIVQVHQADDDEGYRKWQRAQAVNDSFGGLELYWRRWVFIGTECFTFTFSAIFQVHAQWVWTHFFYYLLPLICYLMPEVVSVNNREWEWKAAPKRPLFESSFYWSGYCNHNFIAQKDIQFASLIFASLVSLSIQSKSTFSQATNGISNVIVKKNAVQKDRTKEHT